jgi:hypothetical protein
MLRRLTAIALAALLLQTFAAGASVRAETREEKDARRAERVKRAVGKLGTGGTTQVIVRMKDKTSLEGFVNEIGPDTFVVVGRKANVSTTVRYVDVERIRGGNMTTGAKVAIGFGVAAGFVGALYLFALIVGPYIQD